MAQRLVLSTGLKNYLQISTRSSDSSFLAGAIHYQLLQMVQEKVHISSFAWMKVHHETWFLLDEIGPYAANIICTFVIVWNLVHLNHFAISFPSQGIVPGYTWT